MTFTLTSPAFAEGETMPDRFTQFGDNVSPPLRWTDAPQGTRSFALLMEDPDTAHGTVRHWALYDVPAATEALPEASDTAEETRGFPRGDNVLGNQRYDGPRPPDGDPPHRYRIRLAALDVPNLGLPGEAGAERIWQEAQKHALAQAELVGMYGR